MKKFSLLGQWFESSLCKDHLKIIKIQWPGDNSGLGKSKFSSCCATNFLCYLGKITYSDISEDIFYFTTSMDLILHFSSQPPYVVCLQVLFIIPDNPFFFRLADIPWHHALTHVFVGHSSKEQRNWISLLAKVWGQAGWNDSYFYCPARVNGLAMDFLLSKGTSTCIAGSDCWRVSCTACHTKA